MSDQQSPGPWEGRSEVRGLVTDQQRAFPPQRARAKLFPSWWPRPCRWPRPVQVTWTQGGTAGHGWVRARVWADPGQAVRAAAPGPTSFSDEVFGAALASTFLGRPYGVRWTLVGFTPSSQETARILLHPSPQLGPLVIEVPSQKQ